MTIPAVAALLRSAFFLFLWAVVFCFLFFLLIITPVLLKNINSDPLVFVWLQIVVSDRQTCRSV